MTVSAELESDLSLEVTQFHELKDNISRSSPFADLVKEFGMVYVTSITRQGCSGCESQKPLFLELTRRMNRENPGKARFRNIHINYGEKDREESLESKRLFGHAAYPTYTIHVKSRMGPLEVYRAVYPTMEEVERQVKEAFELADFYETDADGKNSL